jgi:hypothetical protein
MLTASKPSDGDPVAGPPPPVSPLPASGVSGVESSPDELSTPQAVKRHAAIANNSKDRIELIKILLLIKNAAL